MKAPETLIDERKSGGFRLKKQDVIIAADLAIKSGQAFWGEIAGCIVVKGGLIRNLCFSTDSLCCCAQFSAHHYLRDPQTEVFE
jgi:hypothetical protein